MAETAPCSIRPATASDLGTVRGLFAAYSQEMAYDTCFAGFAGEIAGLPGAYAPPGGALLVAERDGAVVGCVGLMRSTPACGEIKRLFVAESARGHGTGRALMEAALRAARAIGYTRVRLETLPRMEAARALYSAMGFVNQTTGAPGGVVVMETVLTATETP
ncbi:MAG: GNAT family N-acetyltransferase [Nitrospirota bacterium]|nr:GNAT family N-acetyltransferase [Nitrospirota bacterium]